jgi:putative nucleotidyltransferase with HDIG domain
MAFDVAQPDHLIDPTGGLNDLRGKIIRACLPTSLRDDPARVLRAVRQALSLKFRIDPETMQLARSAAALLDQISPERRRDELFKMLDGHQVARAVEILDHLGALGALLPEMPAMKGVTQSAPHVEDVWNHTLAVVSQLEAVMDLLAGPYEDGAADDLFSGLAVLRLGRFREKLGQHFELSMQFERTRRALLFLAALYHDIAKPTSRSVEADGKIRFLGHPETGAQVAAERARALTLSNDEVQLLERIINEHMRCHFMTTELLSGGGLPSRRAIFRYFRDTGPAGVDICLLSLADMRGTSGVALAQADWLAELDVCRALLEAYWEQGEQVVSPPRLLTGHDVMHELGLKPGQLIGRLLDVIREGQAAGEINSREEALAYARRWLAQPPEVL